MPSGDVVGMVSGMVQNAIAIICDCDGTLCPDTTKTLISELGLDQHEFWIKVGDLVEQGWDPPLAYLNKLLSLSRSGEIEPITIPKLKEVAEAVEFYPGALSFIDDLRRKLRDAGVTIDWYIVSSGIEALLDATALGNLATDVFGCALEHGPNGEAIAVKRSVTFTEKTKFIYAINKGIVGNELRRNPYRVNDAIGFDERRVPFNHMVYLGDGPSDIPCFSMIKKNQGHAIGVMPPEDVDLIKPFELARGQRLTVGPYTADYRDGSDLIKLLWRIVESMANSILEERAQRIRPAPGH